MRNVAKHVFLSVEMMSFLLKNIVFTLLFLFLLGVEIQCVDIMQKESLWVVVETYEVLNGALARERTVVMSGYLVGIAP